MAHSLTRRTVLTAGAVAGTAVVLDAMSFDPAVATTRTPAVQTKTITGHLANGAADWVYLPVVVPSGARRITVRYSYDRPPVADGVPGNSCDIGVFDQRGIDVSSPGFRGWSGGARSEFTISASDATPGYLPGPVGKGTWHVALGPYQIAPQGLDYEVQVTLDFGTPDAPFRPAYPPQSVAGTGADWYRGDAHVHTVHSDGKRTPEELATAARTAGLDFIISTDHNTSSAHALWGPLAGDDLLIVTGEEVTTRNGHYLALGIAPSTWIDWRYRSRDDALPRAARQIRRAGGIVVPAHPFCPYVGCRWKFGYDDADALEVWNGPWTIDDEMAVEMWDGMLVTHARTGQGWLPAMGNSDAHSEPQVVGLPHNVVRADRLAATALTAGLRAGHSWIAESSDVDLDVLTTAGGQWAGIGERLAAPVTARVTVTVAVRGVPSGVVRFMTDEGQMQQTSLPPSGLGTITWTTTPSLAAYVRVEVRHPRSDGSAGNGNAMGPDVQLGAMAALSNPIWLGRS